MVSKVIIPALAAPLIAALVATIGTFAGVAAHPRHPAGALDDIGFRYGQIGVGVPGLTGARHERRPEDDGRHHAGPHRERHRRPRNAGVPTWVIISCALAIGVGTYSGGWRVIRTLGKGLIEICPPQGFAAEAALGRRHPRRIARGFPLSTTHVVSGSVIGTGVGTRLADVRWGLAGRIAVAWAFTLPMAALVGALAFWLADIIGGTLGAIVVFVLAAVMAGAFYVLSRRAPIGPHNVNDEWADGRPPVPEAVSATA